MKKNKICNITSEKSYNNKEKYKKIWKIKYNIEIPKNEVENIENKIINFIKC